MLNLVFLLTASAILVFWGVAHLFPTMSVVKGFGGISADNRRIIMMEWINEGVTLVFIGVITLLVAVFGRTGAVSTAVLLANVTALTVLSVISLFTGFRVGFLPFKLCPVIFMAAAVLTVLGIFL